MAQNLNIIFKLLHVLFCEKFPTTECPHATVRFQIQGRFNFQGQTDLSIYYSFEILEGNLKNSMEKNSICFKKHFIVKISYNCINAPTVLCM